MHDAAFVPERYVLAEFADSDAMLSGTKRMREKGWKDLDTHTPYPVHGIEEALGLGRPLIPKIVFGGAIAGILAAYSMMYFMNVIDWPLNIANRPAHSPPSMVPITFELAVLLAGLSAFAGSLFGLFRFPQPYHPLFESESFRRASIDGFFLSVKLPAGGDAAKALEQAKQVGATKVELVEESER
jgi:hypothetical protein